MTPGGWLVTIALLAAAATVAWLLSRQRGLADELRAARLQVQSLSDLLDVWQWRTDAEHRIQLLRPPQGAPAGAWASLPLGTTLWTHVRCGDEPALRACLDARAPVVDLAVSLPLPDGQVASGQLRGTALHDAQGGFAGYMGTLRVTGTAPAAAPRPAALSRPESAPDTESQSFGYTVSHDLRAPIRVVEGFTKILKEDYGRLLDRIGNDHLDRVLAAAARMNSMIDALLALSQLSTQPLARQPVNLSQLASYIADDLRRQSPDRRVRLGRGRGGPRRELPFHAGVMLLRGPGATRGARFAVAPGLRTQGHRVGDRH